MPPFGRKSDTSIRFFQRKLNDTGIISFAAGHAITPPVSHYLPLESTKKANVFSGATSNMKPVCLLGLYPEILSLVRPFLGGIQFDPAPWRKISR